MGFRSGVGKYITYLNVMISWVVEYPIEKSTQIDKLDSWKAKLRLAQFEIFRTWTRSVSDTGVHKILEINVN